MKKTILSLYDYSGTWSKPYRDNGYTVFQVDAEKNGIDVRLLKSPEYKVHGILAAPPCRVFANSGSRYKRTDVEMINGLSMIDAVMRLVYICKPVFWALENPTGKLIHYIGKPLLYFHPYEYGDPYKKMTGLWGSFNIPVKCPVEPIKARPGHHSIDEYLKKVHGVKFNRDTRAGLRSVTPPGFANQFFLANP